MTPWSPSSHTRPDCKGEVEGRGWLLPYLADLSHAPVLGLNNGNLTVKSASNLTLLQRSGPTSYLQDLVLQQKASETTKLKEALFAFLTAAQERTKERHQGSVMHLRLRYNIGRTYG